MAGEQWQVLLKYNKALFKEERILEMRDRFGALFREAAADPHRRIDSLLEGEKSP